MASFLTDDFSLRTGAVDAEGRLLLLAGHDASDEEDVPHTCVVVVEDGNVTDKLLLDWRSGGVCSIAPQTFVVFGEFGDYLLYRGRETQKGSVFEESNSARQGVMRAGSAVGDTVLWVGMSGLAFVRDARLGWREANAGLPEDVDLEGVLGGSRPSALAYGWRGALYRFSGTSWTPIDTPSNLVLTCGCSDGRGGIYVAGQSGILIFGQDDQWNIVARDSTVEDIWSVSWFQDTLRVATMSFVYELREGSLEPITYQDKIPGSCHHLVDNGSTLWSIGKKDLFRFEDNFWDKVDLPSPL